MPDTPSPHDVAEPVEVALGSEPIDADLALLGEETAGEAREFLAVLRGVGSGESPEQAIPLLLLAVSQILVTGARLGAITDVVPAEQFETDLGADFDVEHLRESLGLSLIHI